jgi:hypothetical protein
LRQSIGRAHRERREKREQSQAKLHGNCERWHALVRAASAKRHVKVAAGINPTAN